MAAKLPSLRDLFTSKPDPSQNTKPRGASGRAHFNGLIELDELNANLAGNAGRRKFDEMYWTDPDIRRLVLMVWSPILAGVWGVEPYGGDEASDKDKEAAELVEWALMEAMRPNLVGHLHEAGPLLIRMGFCPFEQIWTALEWKGKLVQVPRKLDLRLPRSVWKWYQDDFGNLTQIVQYLPNAMEAVIDASCLTYYRIQSEGDNWEGRSLLRAAYKPWLLKDRLERIDAIGQERKAVGVPIVYPPANTDDTTRGEVENVLASMHTSETAYMIAPGPHVSAYHDSNGEGWLVDVIKFDSSSGEGIHKSLTYHKEGITASFLGDFMQLGHHQVGARATADVQEDPFLTAVRALAEIPVQELNDSLVKRIVTLNCPDVEGFPKLTLTLQDETSISELATYIQAGVSAGVIQPDPELEDYVRERADLPPANPEVREQHQEARKASLQAQINGEPLGGGEGPGYQGKPPSGNPDSGLQNGERQKARAATDKNESKPDEGVSRGNSKAPKRAYTKTLAKGDPAWYEQLLSQGEIAQALDDARSRFQQAGTSALADYARQVVDRAKTGRSAPDGAPQALVEALEAEMDHLYQIGVQTVTRELLDQHARLGTGKTVTLDTATETGTGVALYTVRRKRVRKAAQVAARNAAREVAVRIENAALNANATESSLAAIGEQAVEAALRSQAQQVATGALGAGREDAATANKEQILGAYYTSCLDPNTCDECEQSDNGELVAVDSPEYQEESPPNPDCAGGSRCRCMWVYVLTEDPSVLG